VFAAERIHGDDTTVPVFAKVKCRTGRLWTLSCAMISRSAAPLRRPPCSSTRPIAAASIPSGNLAGYAGILQADAYAGFKHGLQTRTNTGPDHGSSMLGARKTQVLRACRHRLEGARARSRP